LMIANEGQVALELIEEDAPTGTDANGQKGDGGKFNYAEADFRSRDVQILTGGDDDEDEEEKALREYRESMAALLPDAVGTNFNTVFENQNELDAGFDAFMDEEYDEDKIGELYEEDVNAKDQVDKKVLEEACDEFIEGTKQRFLGLVKEFGTEEQQNLIPDIKPSERIYEEDLETAEDTEEVKRKLREKKLEIADVFEDESIKRFAANPYDSEPEQEEDDWDADTILSTYTNTDNHPGVIKTQRRVRPSQQMKIELHKQFRVPVDGLIPLAEEITLQKEKKQAAPQPFQRVAREQPVNNTSPREQAE